MQMSTLNYESREKWQRKRLKIETENLNTTKPLSTKTDNPTASPIYLQDSSSHSETGTSDKNSTNRCF